MTEPDDEAVEAVEAVRERLMADVPPSANPDEVTVVPVSLIPKEGGSGMMYGLSTAGRTVYPDGEAVATVHKECVERFDHEQIDLGTTLGFAAVDYSGNLLSYWLRPADAIHD